jgi:hypothetical protein
MSNRENGGTPPEAELAVDVGSEDQNIKMYSVKLEEYRKKGLTRNIEHVVTNLLQVLKSDKGDLKRIGIDADVIFEEVRSLLDTYFVLLETYPEFAANEGASFEGAFPDIPNTAPEDLLSVRPYILAAKERLESK